MPTKRVSQKEQDRQDIIERLRNLLPKGRNLGIATFGRNYNGFRVYCCNPRGEIQNITAWTHKATGITCRGDMMLLYLNGYGYNKQDEIRRELGKALYNDEESFDFTNM